MSDQSNAPLVPRYSGNEYTDAAVEGRRAWLEAQRGSTLNLVGESALPAATLRGNIENAIGAVRMPLGVAGPLHVRGEHADGIFYVPLATTEGALVRSYERGATLITRCGGAQARVLRDENQISPVFRFAAVEEAVRFFRALERGGELWEGIRAAAEATTRHGKLLAVEPTIAGREVEVTLRFQTGDAHGMNMISKAAEAACRWLQEHTESLGYLIFSGLSSEKRPSGRALAGTKGKHVVAGVEVPERLCRLYLHA
jgi:hydroxymethylglutaryl-CoA reductase (NADPH)